jgi:hypothetical protein
MKNFRGQMAKLKVYVVLLRSSTTSFTNLNRHRTRYDITGSKILGGGCITLHETLTLRVQEVASFATTT